MKRVLHGPGARLAATLCVFAVGAAAVWTTRPQSAPAPAVEPRAAMPALTADEAIAPIPEGEPLASPKVALGERLFHDVRFSRDDSLSCASCHSLTAGGADARPRSIGFQGEEGARNAPTVFNSGLNFSQFWDGRAATLEAQVDGPIHNAKELNSSWAEIIAKLARDEALVKQVQAVYPAGLQPANLRNAIAAFERSLTTPNSRFDRYLKGERSALDGEETAGYRLFTEYGCVSCHQGVNMGGNMYAPLGAVRPYYTEEVADLSHLGRYNVTKRNADRHVFRVPSLRNVALTAPYFHDGSIPTLEAAVTLMGKHQLGVTIPGGDVALIVKYLRTLTGEYRGEPL